MCCFLITGLYIHTGNIHFTIGQKDTVLAFILNINITGSTAYTDHHCGCTYLKSLVISQLLIYGEIKGALLKIQIQLLTVLFELRLTLFLQSDHLIIVKTDGSQTVDCR